MRLAASCRKCEYYRDGTCGYEQIMNRKLPCEMGVRCDFLPRYGDASHPRAWRPVHGVDYAKLERLYGAGLTDGEIMKEMNVKRHVVTAWRTMKGVDAHAFTDKYERRLWEMYGAGESDYKIAMELGIYDNTVRNWRKRHGLPANYVHGVRRAENGVQV